MHITILSMKKKDVLQLFGGVTRLAEAIGISHAAVSMWPETLTPILRDRVIAAALRTGRRIPAAWLRADKRFREGGR